jgi:uncharacterized protein YecE (DUF72 family)
MKLNDFSSEKKLVDFRIGTGGWAYFQVPGMDSLDAYSKTFNFVEVNSTFYTIPGINKVTSWRKRVKSDFEFSVRCYQELTHKYNLRPIAESYQILNEMLLICKTLDANVLHIQTPRTFEITPSKVDSIRDLLSSFQFEGIRLTWEIRQKQQWPSYLTNLMQDFNMIPCVDISKEEEPFASDILYSRLFGRGSHNIYQFEDEELRTINNRASEGDQKKVILSFHSLKMFKDAARLKIFKETGKFPSITGSTGLSSLKEVLNEDAKFPSTKEELIKHQGWKVFDLTSMERNHAHKILDKLPERSYNNLGEVLKELEKYWKI